MFSERVSEVESIIKSYHLIFLIIVFISFSNLFSAPLKNVPQVLIQPNGDTLNCFASGDEFHNWLHDENNYTIIQNPKTGYYVFAAKSKNDLIPTDYIVGESNPENMGLKPGLNISEEKKLLKRNKFFQKNPSGYGKAPAVGTLNNLVVFIRFSNDYEFEEGTGFYDGIFNGTSVYGNSMKNYFQEVSYNQLEVHSTFYPIASSSNVISYQDSFPRNYYLPKSISNPNGYTDAVRWEREHTLLENAINYISASIPNNLNIDGDNDGNVDNICFVIAGSPAGWTGLLWPHRALLNSKEVFIKGKKVLNYNFQLQTHLNTARTGVLCHEMFHTLGAPDLYHYSYDGIDPVRFWGLMDYGNNPPQHMSAYMKYKYGGWINSIPEITTDGIYTINPLTDSTNNCYKIASPNSSSEFFIIEYRRRTTFFESPLPGEGLLVYRINNSKYGNGDGPPDEVYLYRPFGTIESNGNPYTAFFNNETGRTKLNDGTNPTAFLSNGSAGGLNLLNISSVGETMSFTVSSQQAKDLALLTPTANQKWLGGVARSITWSSTGIDNIKIEYSSDNGLNWNEIIGSTSAATGSYNWMPEDGGLEQIKIKISDVSNNLLYDEIDGNFTILPNTQENTNLVGQSSISGNPKEIIKRGNYAFVASDYAGLRIMDVSNPEAPFEVGSYDTDGNALGIDVEGNFAFVADNNSGVRIIDISNPANPIETGFYDTPGTARKVKVKGNYLYVADGYEGLRIIDISNHANPVEVGFYDTHVYVNDLRLKDNYAYITKIPYYNGLYVIDISDPANPRKESYFEISSQIYGIDTENNLACFALSDSGIKIVDITNPQGPVELGNLYGIGTVLDVTIEDNYVYVSTTGGSAPNIENGILIVDMSDPALMVKVGSFECTDFVWTSDVESGYIYVVDKTSGLLIIKNELIAAGWVAKNSGIDLGLFSTDFVSNNFGWAVGSQGTILHTYDGAANWIEQNSGTSNQLRGVSFVCELIGWACGVNGTILKTSDGGINWVAQNSGTVDHEFNSIFFIDENNGWACGDYKILKTTNGGTSWLQFNSNFSHELKSIYFDDENIGWAVGGLSGTPNSLILKTTDSGETWFEQSSSGDHWLYSVHFTDAMNGWAAGTAGIMLKTTDGGNSWEYQNSVTTSSLKSIFFLNQNEGWVSGQNGTILNTVNGGANWKEEETGVSQILYSLSFPSDELGLAVGDFGTILTKSIEVLPVELVSFKATIKNDVTQLNWQTATEQNNYGFEIQKHNSEESSKNSEWKNIGFVEGSGNSNSPKEYLFIDNSPLGGKLKYRLKQIDIDGAFEYSEIIEVTLTPDNYKLYQNYPNPFNPVTTIKFSLVEENDVAITIFNILGESVYTKQFAKLSAGFHEYNFDGTQLSSGVYLYSINVEDKFTEVKKMVLLK